MGARDYMKKKIKVMQLIHGFPVGGAEQMVMQYCELLDKDKIDVVALCVHNDHSEFNRELQQKDVRVIYINDVIDKYLLVPAFMRKAVHYCLRICFMRHYIKKEKPDIIHSHLCLDKFLLKARPNKNTRFFHTVHFEIEGYKQDEKKKYCKPLIKLCKRYDGTIIALHEEAKTNLRKLFRDEKIAVLNNAIDMEAFRIVETKEELRDEFEIKQKLMIIGHVGGLRPVKNHDFLLDVFAEVLKKNENAQLWFVGDGVLSEYLQQKAMKLEIRDKVIFWGIRKDIPQLMRMMDIMVFPSLSEGLSLTLVEAQAIGIPLLISDSVSDETAFSNLLHFYSLQKSAKEWAMQVHHILENQNEIRYTNIEKWDIRSNVRKLENLYFQSLGRGNISHA